MFFWGGFGIVGGFLGGNLGGFRVFFGFFFYFCFLIFPSSCKLPTNVSVATLAQKSALQSGPVDPQLSAERQNKAHSCG